MIMLNLEKFDIEKLKSLISLVSEMTKRGSSQKENELSKTTAVDKTLKFGLIVLGVLVIGMILLGVCYKYDIFTEYPLAKYALGLFYILVGASVTMLLILFFSLIMDQNKNFKNFIPNILSIFAKDAEQDAKYLEKLICYSAPYLRYVLSQYQQNMHLPESRAALFSGAIQKIGLLPAFAAVLLLIYKTIENGNYMWGWVLIICYVIFTMFSFYVYLHLERPRQVVELLKLAVEANSEKPDSQ